MDFLLFLQGIRESAGDGIVQLFQFISDIGTMYSIPIVCYIYWSLKKEAGIFAFWSMGLADMLNGLLKLIACVYRPWIKNPAIVPPEIAKAGATGYSFPSGHATRSTAYLGAVGWFFRKNRILFIGTILVTILIGFSRNFLGVHTPQDVLVGIVCGIVSIVLAHLILSWERSRVGRDVVLMVICTIAVAIYLTYITFKSYPMDYNSNGELLVNPQKMVLNSWGACGAFLGLVLGRLMEKRTVRFSDPSSFIVGLRRFCPGVILILLLGNRSWRTVLCNTLTDSWGYFAWGFILSITLIYVYPMVFNYIEGRRNTNVPSAKSHTKHTKFKRNTRNEVANTFRGILSTRRV